jgi:hypothetical protein
MKAERLIISLSADEMKVLEQAARLAGSATEDVAVWARHALLQQARAQVSGHEGNREGDEQPESGDNPPPCVCGSTRDRLGRCDGSCLLQY